jgi:hypothetical protein
LKAHVVLSESPALVFPNKAIIVKSDGDYVFVDVDGKKDTFKRIKISVTARSLKEVAVDTKSFTKTAFKTISDGALLINDSLEEGEKD